jgi:hypothetical protein
MSPDDDGDCFEVAARLVLDWPPSPAHEPLTLVHGRPIGTGPLNLGERYWHAWVEFTEEATIPAHVVGASPPAPFVLSAAVVIDRSNGRDDRLPVEVYYAFGSIRPRDCRRYSRTDVMRQLIEFGHWGPWDDEHPPV